MTREQIRDIVLRELSRIAPEVDVHKLKPHDDLRDDLDLDSMDILRFVTALHSQCHIDIPEADYSKMKTLNACVEYIMQKAQG